MSLSDSQQRVLCPTVINPLSSNLCILNFIVEMSFNDYQCLSKQQFNI